MNVKEIVYFLCDGWRNERLPPELMEGVQGEMPQYLFGKKVSGDHDHWMPLVHECFAQCEIQAYCTLTRTFELVTWLKWIRLFEKKR